MSWLFSQALVEEYSRGTSLAGLPCAQLNVMPTPHKFLRLGKTINPSDLSRFGLTSKVLTERSGTELLMSFLVDSRARTYQLQDQALELAEKSRAYGNTWPGLSTRYSLDSSSWKTALYSSSEDLPWSSVILPKWGMTLNGALFQHPIVERPISVIASGLWPTPCAQERGGMHKPGSHLTLTKALNGYKKGRLGDPSQIIRSRGEANPQWVEWLMGWPIGWTSLRPLETARFQEWQQQHSACLKDK